MMAICEKKLIEDIEYYISHTSEQSGEHYAYKKCKELVERQPKVGEWIPVSEKLPETGTEVLVTLGYTYETDYTMYSIARHIKFEDGESHWCDNRYGYLEWDKYSDGKGGNSSYRVIAWMPLPEPFRGELYVRILRYDIDQ